MTGVRRLDFGEKLFVMNRLTEYRALLTMVFFLVEKGEFFYFIFFSVRGIYFLSRNVIIV